MFWYSKFFFVLCEAEVKKQTTNFSSIADENLPINIYFVWPWVNDGISFQLHLAKYFIQV